MKSYLVMGLFALYVVAVSLGRYLRDEEFFRLTAMKRLWGRSRGLAVYFVSHVALPMVLGIIFISQGVVGDRAVTVDSMSTRSLWQEPTPSSATDRDGRQLGSTSSRVNIPVPLPWDILPP